MRSILVNRAIRHAEKNFEGLQKFETTNPEPQMIYLDVAVSERPLCIWRFELGE